MEGDADTTISLLYSGCLTNMGASLVAQLVKNLLQCRRPRFDSEVKKMHRRRDRLPTSVFSGFPGVSDSKEYTCNAGDLGLVPGLGRSPGEEKGYPLQYSGLENSMDCRVHGVAKSQTRMSNFHKHGGSVGTSFDDRDLGTLMVLSLPRLTSREHEETSVP